jgi:hypothetical protein
MREEEYRKIFCKIELKDEMKARIISGCAGGGRTLHHNGWMKGMAAAACGLLLFFGLNTYTVAAYGVNLVSEFYNLIQGEDRNIVEVNDPERFKNAPDLTADINAENTNTDLYAFLEEHGLTDLFVPQALTKDWELVDSEFGYYGTTGTGTSDDLNPSIGFQLGNETDQIYATVMEGHSSGPITYQVGVDYAETETAGGIEFLIIHIRENLSYEEYKADLDAVFSLLFEGTPEDFHQSRTYQYLAQEEHYRQYSGYGSIIDFSVGGYNYSYCLTRGIDAVEFIGDLSGD